MSDDKPDPAEDTLVHIITDAINEFADLKGAGPESYESIQNALHAASVAMAFKLFKTRVTRLMGLTILSAQFRIRCLDSVTDDEHYALLDESCKASDAEMTRRMRRKP